MTNGTREVRAEAAREDERPRRQNFNQELRASVAQQRRTLNEQRAVSIKGLYNRFKLEE